MTWPTIMTRAGLFNEAPSSQSQTSKLHKSKLVYQQIVNAALLHPEVLVSFPRLPFPETIKWRIRGLCRAQNSRAERVIMKSSVAKHYGCKQAKNCGLIANGRSQANREFSCVWKTNASHDLSFDTGHPNVGGSAWRINVRVRNELGENFRLIRDSADRASNNWCLG